MCVSPESERTQGFLIDNNKKQYMKRTGTIYSEMTNKGRRSVKYVRGSKPVYCFNWVAEITVWGKRYRTRSKHRARVEAWLTDMLEKYGNA